MEKKTDNTTLELVKEIETALTTSSLTGLLNNGVTSNPINSANTCGYGSNTPNQVLTLNGYNTYPTYTPYYLSNWISWQNDDVAIRKVKNGYICKLKGEELVFNKMTDMLKEIDKVLNPKLATKKKK